MPGFIPGSGAVLTGALPSTVGEQEIQQLHDLVIPLLVVTHREMRVDGIPVAPAKPGAGHVPGVHEVPHDALRCSLGYADGRGDVPQTRVGITADAEQHLCVVREEMPVRRRKFRT
jgi:hypothetical protein